MSAELVAALRRRGLTVAFCESLTAGLAAATLADVPGASAVLCGGLITYATDPVSGETAAAMARGVRERCGADWGVSLTGVAGPDPQGAHPVGEVWLGFAGEGGVDKQRLQLSGTRREIREQAANAALTGLFDRVEQSGVPGR